MSNVLDIRNTILAAWAACKNDIDRASVLRAMGSAWHEIMIERIPHEVCLRAGINNMLMRLEAVVMDQLMTPFPLPHYRESSAYTAAIGGVIDVEIGRRAERRGMMAVEIMGTVQAGNIHAARASAAYESRGKPAVPFDGFTISTKAPDVLQFSCPACKAQPGERCVGLAQKTEK